MIPFGLKATWFGLSLAGLISCWCTLVFFPGRKYGGLWGRLYYSIFVTYLEGAFLLGLIWHMDPHRMPHGFCVFQTLSFSIAAFCLSGLMASFTLATWTAVYRPKVGTDSLAWHPRYIPLLVIFPLGASAVLITLVLKLDAVKPVSSDDMHCDVTNPLWIRLFGYGGASPLFSIPFWFLSFATAKKLFQLTQPKRLATDTTNTSEFTSPEARSPQVSSPFFKQTIRRVPEKLFIQLSSAFTARKRRKESVHDGISVEVHTIQVAEDLVIGMRDLNPRADFKSKKYLDRSHVSPNSQGPEPENLLEDKPNWSMSSVSTPEFASNPSLFSKKSEGTLSTLASFENPTSEIKALPSSSLSSSGEGAMIVTSLGPSSVHSPSHHSMNPNSSRTSLTAESGKTLLEHPAVQSPSRPRNFAFTSKNSDSQADFPVSPGAGHGILSGGIGTEIPIRLSATNRSFQRHDEGAQDFAIKASSVLPGTDDSAMRSFKVFDGSTNELDPEVLVNYPMTTSVVLESKIGANRSIILNGNGGTRSGPTGRKRRLGSAIWRLVLFQIGFFTIQLLASLSTIIDVSRGQITPFGTQHVALLVAAWGPFLLYALSKVPASIGNGRWRGD